MAVEYDLIADIREDTGKGASRRLRRTGKVPAVIYGAGRPPRALTFDQNKLQKQMEQASFFSSVLKVKVGNKSQQVILKDVQVHPAKRLIMHLDLQRILEDEKIRMNVPIHLLNTETAIGVKEGGGSVSHLMTEVEISCLPKHLPEYLELDIAELEMDGMLKLSEIVLPEGVEVPELGLGQEHDRGVVSIHKVVEEVEEEEEGEAGEAAEGDESEAAASDEDKSGD